MEKWAWSLVVVVLLLSSTVSARRASTANSALDACEEDRRIFAAESRGLGRVVMELISDDLSRGMSALDPGPSHKVYLILDTECNPCRRLVQWAAGAGMAVEIEVASFTDGPAELQAWLDELGSSLEVVSVPLDRTFLRHLPRSVTPLFLEFDAGSPLEIRVGRPSESWFQSKFLDP